MGIIKRQGFKSSIVNYAGSFLGLVFFILIFPNIIDKDYLGLISLLQYIMFFVFSLTTLGLGHTLVHFYGLWEKEQPHLIRQFNGFSMMMMSIALLLVTILYIGFSDQITGYYLHRSALIKPYFFLAIPMFVAYTFNAYMELYALANFRSAVPAVLREIVNRALLIIAVYLFYFKVFSETQFVWSLSLTYILPLIILFIYNVKVLGFRMENPFTYLKTNKELKTHGTYALSICLVGIFATVHNFVDGIILPAYLGLGALGIYIRPLVLGAMLQIPYRAIGLIATPVLRETILQGDKEKLNALHKTMSLNLFLIGGLLFTLLIINTDGIFAILPPEYQAAKPVLWIIAIGRLLDMAFGLNNEIIINSDRYKSITLFSGISMLVAVILNVQLIPRFGMNGAAIAAASSLIFYNVLKTIFIYKRFHIHCFSWFYWRIAVVIVWVIGLCYFIPLLTFIPKHMFGNALANIIFKSGIGLILFLVPAYFLKISNDFNDFIRLAISGKLFKGGHRMSEL